MNITTFEQTLSPSRLSFLILFVFLGHLMILMLVSIHQMAPQTIPKRKEIVVKTIELTPKPAKKEIKVEPEVVVQAELPTPEPAKEVPEVQKNEIVSKPIQIEKKVIKKTDSKPKPAPKKAKVEKKSKPKSNPKPKPVESKETSRKKELLQKAQSNISKVKQNKDMKAATALNAPAITLDLSKNFSFETNVPSEIENWTPEEHSYYDELAGRLKILLRLPEYGEVKVKLTLEKTGQFIKVAILNAKSKKNREYIESTLPTLKYPGFGKHFNNAEQYTFLLSLNNEI